VLRNISIIAFMAGVASAAPRLHPVHNADGSIQVGSHSYPSQKAYFESAEWQQSGGRCGSDRIVFQSPVIAPSDCDMNGTRINADYTDGRTLVVQVVFHLVQKTDGTGNITDDQVRSQIQVLNEDYDALANTHGSMGNNASIKFVLARFDPMGNPTTGIERVTNNAYFSEGDASTSAMKNALHWDTTRYLNIYSSGLDASGLLGYATFPTESAGLAEDGVVLAYQSVGVNPAFTPYDLGASATHEVGHYFGLLHTFQTPLNSHSTQDTGCTGNANTPYQQGDFISDTPRDASSHGGCTPAPSDCGDAGKMVPIENYMEYTDDSCMTKFTVEQVNRMRCSIVNYRAVNTEPKSLFTFAANHLALTFTSTSTDAESTAAQLHYNWDFGDGATSTDQNPMHTYAAAGNYNVKLEVVDPGSAANTSTQAIAVSDTGMGSGSDGSGSDGSGSDGSGTGGGGDAGTSGGNEAGGMNGGCCQAPKGGLSFLLCGFPVAFVLLRRRKVSRNR
jgi:hypothetical protein